VPPGPPLGPGVLADLRDAREDLVRDRVHVGAGLDRRRGHEEPRAPHRARHGHDPVGRHAEVAEDLEHVRPQPHRGREQQVGALEQRQGPGLRPHLEQVVAVDVGELAVEVVDRLVDPALGRQRVRRLEGVAALAVVRQPEVALPRRLLERRADDVALRAVEDHVGGQQHHVGQLVDHQPGRGVDLGHGCVGEGEVGATDDNRQSHLGRRLGRVERDQALARHLCRRQEAELHVNLTGRVPRTGSQERTVPATGRAAVSGPARRCSTAAARPASPGPARRACSRR
jgi:hypothetical protein